MPETQLPPSAAVPPTTGDKAVKWAFVVLGFMTWGLGVFLFATGRTTTPPGPPPVIPTVQLNQPGSYTIQIVSPGPSP